MLRDGSPWLVRDLNSKHKNIPLLEFIAANPLATLSVGFQRPNVFVAVPVEGNAVRNVFFRVTVQGIGSGGAELEKLWVFQSEALTTTGIPAVTVACCDALKGTKQLLSSFYDGIGVAAVITDVPWGDSKTAMYPTDIDWNKAAKNVFGACADANASLEKEVRSVDLGSQKGDTIFTVLGTLEVLNTIEEEVKAIGLNGYVNLPGKLFTFLPKSVDE